jgi:acyl carrier protein
MNNAAQRAQIEEYVQKAFIAKIMQMNDIRQSKKLELRGEVGCHGRSANSSAWMIGEIEIEEDCIANLLRQKADLYIGAYRRVGLAIGPAALQDIAHSQAELIAARKSSLIGEAQLLAVRTNKPQNLIGYGHLGKKASVAMKEIEASIDLYNLSYSAKASNSSRTTEARKGGLNQENLPAPSSASEHPSDRDGSQRYGGGEVEKLRISGNSAPSPQDTIWTKIWSWGAVSVFASLILAGWMTFMTSGHPQAADGFLLAGTALFLVKFWTWEEARRQPPLRKWLLQAGVTLPSLAVAVLAVFWNHAINRAGTTSHSGDPSATGSGTTPDKGKDAPLESKPEEQTGKDASPAAGGRSITIADRVKLIIVGHLQVNAVQLKSNDDFEADLGADPADVYFLMRSLEQEYDITIPSRDSKNLHTVGETISYIEKRVSQKQEQKPVQNAFPHHPLSTPASSRTQGSKNDVDVLEFSSLGAITIQNNTQAAVTILSIVSTLVTAQGGDSTSENQVMIVPPNTIRQFKFDDMLASTQRLTTVGPLAQTWEGEVAEANRRFSGCLTLGFLLPEGTALAQIKDHYRGLGAGDLPIGHASTVITYIVGNERKTRSVPMVAILWTIDGCVPH